MKKRASRSKRSINGKAPYFCCRTCQSRRIKCDGSRPSCTNCTSQHRVCGGYSSWDISLDVATALASTRYVAQHALTSQETQLPYFSTPASPVCNDNLTDEMRHAFDYFRYQTCAKYVERGYPILWATSSLSVALQEPAMFYAMIALSEAEQSLVPTVHTTLARPLDKQKRDTAFRNYLQAISYLGEPMRKAIKGTGSLEPIILSCLMFLVFEATMGNHLNAMRHARIGRSILAERLGYDDVSDSSSSSSPLANLSPPFRELAMLCNEQSFDDTPSFSPLSTKFISTTVFASIQEARSCLEMLIEAGQEIREQLISKAQDMATGIPSDISRASKFCLICTYARTMSIDISCQRRLNDIFHAFAGWGRKFGQMYRSGDFISRDLFFMQIRFFYASFTLAMCRSSNERLADTFSDQFVRTLESGERLMRQRPLLSGLPSEELTMGPVAVRFMAELHVTERGCFQDSDAEAQARPQVGAPASHEAVEDRAAGVFEFGMLHALFTIACKCRSTTLRRKAARLLAEAKRTEAIDSSRILSAYAEAIIHLEEQQAAHATGIAAGSPEFYADEVPEHARFLDVVAHPLPNDSKFVLSCTMRVSQDSSDIALLEYECDKLAGEYRLIQSLHSPYG